MRFGLSESVIERIASVLSRFPQVRRAVVYGSRAKGTYKPGSDIDLTLLGEGLDSGLMARISSELDDLFLPYSIDLSVFSQLDHPDLLDHIERIGEELYRAPDA